MSLPAGHYTKVWVVDPLGGQVLLRDGTATMNEGGLFSAGPFARGEYPNIGQRYKVTGNGPDGHEEDALFCVASGHQTCDFKENR